MYADVGICAGVVAVSRSSAVEQMRRSSRARREPPTRRKSSRWMRFFACFLEIAKSPLQKRDHREPVWIGYAP
jgi:hypothetical protein